MSVKRFSVADTSSPVVAGFEVRSRPVPESADPVHSNPLLNRLYLARGIRSVDELNTDLKRLENYQALKGLEQAVALLDKARREQWKVIIVGDYDTDGATSTALAMLGLGAMGLNIDFVLPNRFEFGYGLSVAIVEHVAQQSPDLIITVDNGIASIDGVARAKSLGIKVLVTDHHLPAQQLPNADAIVNPNQPGCGFASKAACGCTVLYYLLISFRALLREQGVSQLPNLGAWLDLVALATIADVVPLDKNNRLLVYQGLQRIRAGKARAGILALFEVAGRDWKQARSLDMGFVVGPRLNAAGRLDDMTLGVQLLLTDDPAKARSLAAQLNDFNVERRQIEASMLQELEHLDLESVNGRGQASAVVTGENWHEGVIGIVASRLKDRLHRPVVALSSVDDQLMKGSARSVPGVHLRDCLDWVATKDKTVLEKFGGHAMAAGLTLAATKLAIFTELFDQAVLELSEPEALLPHLMTDGSLEDSEVNLENALAIEQAGPWGQHFPEPSFYGAWQVLDGRWLQGKHLKLTLKKHKEEISAIAFNCTHLSTNEIPAAVHGIYQLSCNRFRDNISVQLIFNRIDASALVV
jgi:single-stranded-DNA-specific exonuclease